MKSLVLLLSQLLDVAGAAVRRVVDSCVDGIDEIQADVVNNECGEVEVVEAVVTVNVSGAGACGHSFSRLLRVQ